MRRQMQDLKSVYRSINLSRVRQMVMISNGNKWGSKLRLKRVKVENFELNSTGTSKKRHSKCNLHYCNSNNRYSAKIPIAFHPKKSHFKTMFWALIMICWLQWSSYGIYVLIETKEGLNWFKSSQFYSIPAKIVVI